MITTMLKETGYRKIVPHPILTRKPRPKTLSPAKGTTPPSLYLYRDRQTLAGHCMRHWCGDSRHLAQICMAMVDTSQA